VAEDISDGGPYALEEVLVMIQVHARVQFVLLGIVGELERMLVAETGALKVFGFHLTIKIVRRFPRRGSAAEKRRRLGTPRRGGRHGWIRS
jgi:hypothetical protein